MENLQTDVDKKVEEMFSIIYPGVTFVNSEQALDMMLKKLRENIDKNSTLNRFIEGMVKE